MQPLSNPIVRQWLPQFCHSSLCQTATRLYQPVLHWNSWCECELQCSSIVVFPEWVSFSKSVTLNHTKALISKRFVSWSYRSGHLNATHKTEQFHVSCQQIHVIHVNVFHLKLLVFPVQHWFDNSTLSNKKQKNKKTNVEIYRAQAENISLKLDVRNSAPVHGSDLLIDLHTGIRGVGTVDVKATTFLRSLTWSMYEL